MARQRARSGGAHAALARLRDLLPFLAHQPREQGGHPLHARHELTATTAGIAAKATAMIIASRDLTERVARDAEVAPPHAQLRVPATR